LKAYIYMVRIWPGIQDLTTNTNRQRSTVEATQNTMSQTGIQLVGMVSNGPIVTTLLLHSIALLPNLFAEQLPITGSLAAKVTGYRSWIHQLLLLLLILSLSF
jgi:beta-lactamase regulating signal transducer with metallopeptidase domain